MTGTDERKTKQEKRQQDFLWALGLAETHQLTKSEYRTDQDKVSE